MVRVANAHQWDEKTAIIAAGFYPEYLWMASGGKKNNFERLKKILAGKKVLLFPDMDAISEWKKLPFPMCDLKPFAGKPEKYDLADLLTEKKQTRLKKQLHLVMICKQCKRNFKSISENHEFCTSRCDQKYQKENLTDTYIILQVIKDLMQKKEYTTKDDIPKSLIDGKRTQLQLYRTSHK